MLAKILCVEDEPLLRRDLTMVLKAAEYEVIEVSNGREGLDAILTHTPDLVLCDIMMPEIDGYQVLASLREQHRHLSDLPFVFLTALADKQAVILGTQQGADDYVTKPIDYDLLLSTVGARLRQVARMRMRHEADLIKVYTALTRESGEATSPVPVPAPVPLPVSAQAFAKPVACVVCNDPNTYRELSLVLLKLGFQVEHHLGGRAFLSSLDQRRPDLVVFGYYTADLTAPFALKLGGLSSTNADFPLVLARPPSMAGMPVSKEEQGLFHSIIGFPIARETLVKRLRPYLPAAE